MLIKSLKQRNEGKLQHLERYRILRGKASFPVKLSRFSVFHAILKTSFQKICLKTFVVTK